MAENITQTTALSETMTGAVAGIPAGPSGYDLLDEVGRGGMGVVYRARDAALGRDVAVKVLQVRFPPDSPAALRFLDEARITGQLQHPGIPAVHQVGEMPDRRPFLVMKLIKGRTLAEVLKGKPERGELLAIFEAVCQAVGYAHAHSVIHRDLKPQNVMVGAFGEVQVMDWGLAKVLGERPQASAPATATAEETRAWTEVSPLRESDGSYTQAGSLVGTPAYVPPKQAAGELAKVDERADVFGLGALLTVILTGQPPYDGKDAESVRVMAIRGELTECLARLDACGAEPELVALCKRCLSFAPSDRPRHAGEVATAVAGLRAEAENRARQAEVDRVRADGERAAAEARATEQRKRRRVQLALAAAIVLMLCGGGVFAWWQDRQAAKDQARYGRNAEAVDTLLTACEEALRADDPQKAALALDAAQKRAAEGGAEHLAGRFARGHADLEVLRELDAADSFQASDANQTEALLEVMKQVAAQWRAAFQEFGVILDETPADEVARRITESQVRDRLLNALDRWLRAEPLARVRAVLAAADPDEYRDAVRDAIMARDKAKVAELAARPEALAQPAAFTAAIGESALVPIKRRREMLQVALRSRPGNLILLMALANDSSIRADGAADLLRWSQAAVAAHPRNLRPHWALGLALHANGDPDGSIAEYKEAIRLDPKSGKAHIALGTALGRNGDLAGRIAEYKEAIRLEPRIASFHLSLARMLEGKGDLEEALAAYKEAVRLEPKSGYLHGALAYALHNMGKPDEAIPCYKEAIRLDPLSYVAHNNLGNSLRSMGDLDGAIAEYNEAIRLAPTFALAHCNLGGTLQAKGFPDKAIAERKEAIRLNPKFGPAHSDLAAALLDKGDVDEAIVECKEAIRLDPKYAWAHNNLGAALRMKGHADEAIAEIKEAIRLDPKLAVPHDNLARSMRAKDDLDGAIAEIREAIRLDPKFAGAHRNLGSALADKGNLDAAIAAFQDAIRLEPKNQYGIHSLRRTERMRELLPRLSDIVAGKSAPATPIEARDFGLLCAQPFQKKYVAALRLYEKAFAGDSKLAETLLSSQTYRYDAACCAAVAARGEGVDAPTDLAERAALRGKALNLLRTDLAYRNQQLSSASVSARKAAADALSNSLIDSDLSGLRPGNARIEMSAGERAQWDAFWADVKRALTEARKLPPSPATKQSWLGSESNSAIILTAER